MIRLHDRWFTPVHDPTLVANVSNLQMMEIDIVDPPSVGGPYSNAAMRPLRTTSISGFVSTRQPVREQRRESGPGHVPSASRARVLTVVRG